MECSWLLFTCVVSLPVLSVHGLYFYMGEMERKCFVEEVPEETLITGKYKMQRLNWSAGAGLPPFLPLGLFVKVTDENGLVPLIKVYSSEGAFTLTTRQPGQHTICLESNSTQAPPHSMLRVFLDIQVGVRAKDYITEAQKQRLARKMLYVRVLLEQVEQISKDLTYQRYRSMRFREVSESTNQYVKLCSVIQVGIFLVMIFWQVRLLVTAFSEWQKMYVGLSILLYSFFACHCISLFFTENYNLFCVSLAGLLGVLVYTYVSLLAPLPCKPTDTEATRDEKPQPVISDVSDPLLEDFQPSTLSLLTERLFPLESHTRV